jgi:hypothetical protein
MAPEMRMRMIERIEGDTKKMRRGTEGEGPYFEPHLSVPMPGGRTQYVKAGLSE